MWLHADWFGTYEALKAMTSVRGELAQLTGKKTPYPGKVGVIKEGADILLVDGDALQDITALGANPQKYDVAPRGETMDTLPLIMKNGKIHKNTL